MYRRTQRALRFGDQLSLQDVFADSDNGLSRVAYMLRDRQNELRGNGNVQNRLLG